MSATVATLQSRSPFDPADVIGAVAVDPPSAVRCRVDQARLRATTWSATPAAVRSRALHDAATQLEAHTGELVDLAIREVGKPFSEAAGELQRAVGILRYYAQACLLPTGEVLPSDTPGGRLSVERRPYGVVGLVTPWNFPVAIPLWKAAPALAAGNAVVVKASPLSAVTTDRALSVVASCLPSGTLQVVHGEVETGTALVDAVDMVSFTGSNAVGARVIAAATSRGVPVQAEMGGSNAALVLPDAPESAVRGHLAYAVAGYAGQKCTATRRIIVVGDAVPVAETLRDALAALPIGDPRDPATAVGPVISEAAAAAVVGAVERSVGSSATVLWAGPEPRPSATLVTPAVVVGAPEDAVIRCAEVFGPAVAVVGVPDVETAVRVANETPFGLTASVHTADVARGTDLAGRLHAGMVKVNEPTTGVSFQAPFGGEGRSSFGLREQGRTALEAFTWPQTLTVGPVPTGSSAG